MKYLYSLIFLLVSFTLFSQKSKNEDKNVKSPDDEFVSTKVDSIEQDIFNPEVIFQERKKKKPKKNEYYGFRTKKGFTRAGGASNPTIELFNYLKEYKDPNPYIPNTYWFSTKDRKIRSTEVDKPHALILHGPYMKIVNEDTVEEGSFYMGARHGRWIFYKNNKLVDKKTYHKGWPKEAEITYYDSDQKKVKEVIPKQFGIIDGDYYTFYENGLVKEKGQYKYGAKVGKWIEYHKLKRKTKMETQYPTDPYDKNFQPYKIKEYDERGNIIYDYEKDKKAVTTKKN